MFRYSMSHLAILASYSTTKIYAFVLVIRK